MIDEIDSGLSLIVRTVACILAIPVIIFGLYVVMHGHLTPGGGFAGGAVMATLTALLLVAFGKDFAGKSPRKEIVLAFECLGLIAFVTIGFLGLGTTFFGNFLANSGSIFGASIPFGPNQGYLGTGGVTPLMNLAVGLEVFAATSLVVLLIYKGTGDDEK